MAYDPFATPTTVPATVPTPLPPVPAPVAPNNALGQLNGMGPGIGHPGQGMDWRTLLQGLQQNFQNFRSQLQDWRQGGMQGPRPTMFPQFTRFPGFGGGVSGHFGQFPLNPQDPNAPPRGNARRWHDRSPATATGDAAVPLIPAHSRLARPDDGHDAHQWLTLRGDRVRVVVFNVGSTRSSVNTRAFASASSAGTPSRLN
jgi:hypothetical protein